MVNVFEIATKLKGRIMLARTPSKIKAANQDGSTSALPTVTAGSSSSGHHPIVDSQDDIYPIADEKYAEQLQLEEALIFSSASLIASSNEKEALSGMSEPPFVANESSQLPNRFCDICMDTKTESEMFRNTKVCGHMFCFDCIRGHVAAKIQENITKVRCPDPNCKGVIGPEACRFIVPQEVLNRWEKALCESVIVGSQKFYCPFKDCSAMLVNDGGEAVTSSECPHCYRLFCAQCKVAWHSGMGCSDFQRLKKGGIDQSDDMLMNLAKNKKWKKCPNCNFYVEKVDGCLHISCRCGHQFCYRCGKNHIGISLGICLKSLSKDV